MVTFDKIKQEVLPFKLLLVECYIDELSSVNIGKEVELSSVLGDRKDIRIRKLEKETKLNKKEKEKDSFSEGLNEAPTRNQIISNYPQKLSQRSLLCASKKRYDASVTVEVSMVLPLFLFGLMCLIFLLEMMAIQMTVRSGMQEVASTFSSTMLDSSGITNSQLEEELIAAIGEVILDRSIIVGGSNGLKLENTEIDHSNGAVKLVVDYELSLPFPGFLDFGMAYQESVIFKRWTGYGGGLYFANGQMVYITEYQSVYHLDPSCSHLQLQISIESANSIASGNYNPCGACRPGELDNLLSVYITATGSSYHGTIECSSLKRTVTSVSIDDVIGKGVCQRCG